MSIRGVAVTDGSELAGGGCGDHLAGSPLILRVGGYASRGVSNTPAASRAAAA
jgi:hypothetical protein